MRHGPLYGLILALVGTLVLTPDAMLMRLSGMEGFQMAGWRGLLMGGVMLAGWVAVSRDRAADLRGLASKSGIAIVVCQVFNSMLFCLGIAMAPAAIVLIGVAAVPVCSAVLSWLLIGEPTRAATWAAIAAVTVGIVIAVLGGDHGALSLDWRAVTGAVLGLGVAVVLALNFVILRSRPHVPILLAIGLGALIAGVIGTAITGPAQMADGRIWAMGLTGAVVLPVSFFLLSLASRHTHASNVSLLMLLETVLGPLWVWLGIGERPTSNMLIGGAIVVVSLAVYLATARRRARRQNLARAGH